MFAIISFLAISEVSLTKSDFAGLNTELEKHRGKVVLIDVWYPGCLPCVKKFPDFVALHESYAEKGLVCISLNPVSESSEEARVLKFLQERKARFTNLLITDTPENEKKWSKKYPVGNPPTMILFDRKGEQKKVFDEKATRDEIEKEIKSLLEAK